LERTQNESVARGRRGSRRSPFPRNRANKAIRWHPEWESKGKQPGINIAPARNKRTSRSNREASSRLRPSLRPTNPFARRTSRSATKVSQSIKHRHA